MLDIVHSDKRILAKAKKLGISPLVIGKEVAIVSSLKELKKTRSLIVLGSSNERSLIEGPVDGLCCLEVLDKKDHVAYRRGGFNEVCATILAKDQKALFLSFSCVKQAEKSWQVLGRMKQNAMLAYKAQVPIIIASFASTTKEVVSLQDLLSFFVSMGIPEQYLLTSQKHFAALLERAKLRASDKYLGEGISAV